MIASYLMLKVRNPLKLTDLIKNDAMPSDGNPKYTTCYSFIGFRFVCFCFYQFNRKFICTPLFLLSMLVGLKVKLKLNKHFYNSIVHLGVFHVASVCFIELNNKSPFDA